MKNKLDLSPALDLEPASPGEHAPALRQDSAPAVHTSNLSPLSILEKAITGGVTRENVEVVKELVAMAREQRVEDAKAAFAAAFFRLRKNMPEIYADKEGKDLAGNPTFAYCSEEEISKKLEPHLMTYGFAMLCGQSEANGRVTINVTLIHEAGHSETREFTVHAGKTNRMKDESMVDTGAATTAWRHLMMKMFGLKSRISRPDVTLQGERITDEQAMWLKEQVSEMNLNEKEFLEFADVMGSPIPAPISEYRKIYESAYPRLAAAIEKKRKKAMGAA